MGGEKRGEKMASKTFMDNFETLVKFENKNQSQRDARLTKLIYDSVPSQYVVCGEKNLTERVS